MELLMPDFDAVAGPRRWSEMPAPPRLHWAWVLVLSIITVGLFWGVWLVVQAAWTRRVRGGGAAIWFAIFYLVIFSARLLLEVTRYALVPSKLVSTVSDTGRTLNLVGYVAAVSMLWFEMKEKPVGLWLSGWGTYLLGPIYFQYSLSEAKTVKDAADLSAVAPDR
jgi:hypothetical protein